LPGDPVSHNEFRNGIKKAEEGPFYTVEESKNLLKEWREEKNSR
jgi:predicted transcriptional regulator